MEFYRRRKIEGNIDMTPMIDTLLQLFMIFLLSASFVASAVRLNLPRAAGNQKEPAKAIVVSLNGDNELFLNGESISQVELRPRLQALFRQTNKQEVVLRAELSLPYKNILKTMVELQRAGAATVHLSHDEER